MKTIYFDYAATAPTDPLVVEAMSPYFTVKFGNPSSPHSYGRDAQKAIEDARVSLSRLINAQPQEVVFTSGGTEANNTAIFGVARRLRSRGNHIILSAVEHHSVLEPVENLQQQGYRVSYVPVERNGRVNLDALAGMITGETILVAVMHANNEVGTIQPIREISQLTKEKKVLFMVDAVQTVGHIPVDVNDLGADFLTLSAHKFYGPKGVGALYIRKGVQVDRFLFGGDQERNRRASTHNLPGIVGLGKAADICLEKMNDEITLQTKLRNKLIQEVPRRVEGVFVNGDLQNRLPNNAHFSFEKLQGEALLMSLDMNQIAASMGSACTSGAMEPSHVLRAMGISDELAYGSLRITLGRWSTEADVDYFLDCLPRLVKGLRI